MGRQTIVEVDRAMMNMSLVPRAQVRELQDAYNVNLHSCGEGEEEPNESELGELTILSAFDMIDENEDLEGVVSCPEVLADLLLLGYSVVHYTPAESGWPCDIWQGHAPGGDFQDSEPGYTEAESWGWCLRHALETRRLARQH